MRPLRRMSRSPMTHLALLHRARTALIWPDCGIDKWAVVRDLDEALKDAYPTRPKTWCYCGEENCNDHSEFNLGDG